MSDCKYKRVIEPHPATASVIQNEMPKDNSRDPKEIHESDLGDPKEWLQKKNLDEEIHAEFLLAHAEDGVIWGKFDDIGNLITSFEASKDPKYTDLVKGWGRAALRKETLWQARIFGKDAELYLWRDGDNLFHARVIHDRKADDAGNSAPVTFQDAFDEPQILWGTDAQKLDGDFTLMTDGAQGMRHAAPLTVASVEDESKRPLRLIVRHYLANEDFARVAASRLVKVEVAK